jgi:hypothetical protein
VCARERAAARPSTPAAIQALELRSCELLRILQHALASQSTKSKKARHKLKQQKPATATIPVRVEFGSCTIATHPGQGPRSVHLDPTSALCCSSSPVHPLPLWVSACPDGSDSRYLAPFCRCIWKQTHLLRQHRANPGPSHSHTPSLSYRHPLHCRSGTRFLSTAVF